MATRGELVDTSSAASAARIALALLAAHLFLDLALGQYYAKQRIALAGIELYPTEIVLLGVLVVSARSLVNVAFDTITRWVVVFAVLGVAWILIGGVGGWASAGAKAFSFFIYAAFYFVVRCVARSDESRQRILFMFGVASCCGALLGFWHMHSGAPLFPGAEFEETTTGSIRWLPGEFGLYALLGAIAIAIPAIIRRKLTATTGILLAAAAAELILAQHRSGFVALAIALVATALALGVSGEALKGAIKLVVIAAVVVACFTWLFGSAYLDETFDRIAHSADTNDVNIEWRLLCWYDVFDGVIAKPLGHGFAVWDFFFTADDPLTGSHNSLLDLTYRIGVPGLVAFAAMPVLLFKSTRRLVQRMGAKRHIIPITACAAIVAFLVYASLNVVLETPHMSIFFWVLLGVGSGAVYDARFNDAA